MNQTIIELPSTFIEKDAVNYLVSNYQNGKHQLLSTAIEKSETKSGWYTRDQFEEMVREMEHQNASGVRVYFGAYDSNHPQYANQLTLIFVPTSFDENTETHKDIIIDDQPDYEDRLAMTPSFMEKGRPKNLDSIGLCPPGCAGQESFYPM